MGNTSTSNKPLTVLGASVEHEGDSHIPCLRTLSVGMPDVFRGVGGGNSGQVCVSRRESNESVDIIAVKRSG